MIPPEFDKVEESTKKRIARMERELRRLRKNRKEPRYNPRPYVSEVSIGVCAKPGMTRP